LKHRIYKKMVPLITIAVGKLKNNILFYCLDYMAAKLVSNSERATMVEST
jgi:hypothetical protein